MPLDRKKAVLGALDRIDSDLSGRRGAQSLTLLRTRGSLAAKGSQNPSGSGGTVGRIDEKDSTPHQDMDTGDSAAQVQAYEKKMLGRTPRTSDHLREADETSVMQKNAGASEGDDDYPGSIENKGGDSFNKSTAMNTTDETTERGQEEVSDQPGPTRGLTGQEHRPVNRNRGGIAHLMGKKVP